MSGITMAARHVRNRRLWRRFPANGRFAVASRIEPAMNVLLWVLQVLGALVYGASGVMKAFMFDAISRDVPTFGALPRAVWMALGVVELACAIGLVVPGLARRGAALIPLAAGALAAESLVLMWAHLQYGETAQIAMVAALGLLMAFVAYGRARLRPVEERAVRGALS
jgi:hypothetical protein